MKTRAAVRTVVPRRAFLLGMTAPLILGRVMAGDAFEDRLRLSARNLRRIVAAMHTYHDRHGNRLPRPALLDASGRATLSWRVALLPHLGERALYEQFRLDEPWDSRHNSALLQKRPDVYAPVGRVKAEPGATFYQAFVGPGTAFDPVEALDYPDFTDGTVNTLAVVEGGKTVLWTEPADLRYRPGEPLPRLGGVFEDGFTAAFVSGDVRFFDHKLTDETTVAALITRAGGEVVSPDAVGLRIP